MMADDYAGMTGVWGTQFVLIFFFLFVGMCQQFKCDGGKDGYNSSNNSSQSVVLAVTSTFDGNTNKPKDNNSNMFYK